MKNIYFIEAKSPRGHIFSKWPISRLGSILLGTIFHKNGYNVKVFVEDIAPVPWNELEDADLICISSITPTITRAFQIADRFKKAGIPVAIGGPHSTFLPEESLEYADYVIRGEGEETLVELVEHLENEKNLNDINGLSFKDNNGNIINNPRRELIENLDEAPIPNFDLVYKWEKVKFAPIATSRGCPFACKFCSVIQMFGRKYRFKSIDRIIDEIKSAAPNKNSVFFIDDNFTANKKRTKNLLRRIIDEKINFKWSAQVRTDVATDPELLKLMKLAGCFAVYIGFESINPKTLALYNKGQSLKDIENSIRLVKQHNINIHGMFVLGSDEDTIQTIKDTAKFSKKLNLESIQFMVLTPYPGTPVFEDLESSGRLIHTDWSKYDAHHAVFEPKQMTVFELHLETLKAMRKFYSWPALLRNLYHFDFFYTAVCGYGIKSTNSALKGAKNYLANLKEDILIEFDNKTEGLRKKIRNRKKLDIKIVEGDFYQNSPEEQFLTTFLKKARIIPVVHIEENSNRKPVISITLPHPQEEKTFLIESMSNFKLCEELSKLFEIQAKKLRKAYEEASKKIANKNIAFNNIKIVVK